MKNIISKYAVSVVTMLAALVLGTSCEHKPLYEREPFGGERKVKLNFDWSLLESENEHPDGVTVLFYDKTTGGYKKFDIPRDDEDKIIIVPSGMKDLYVINNDEPDFDVLIGEKYPQILMNEPYLGLEKIYTFDDDVTIFPPEEGNEDDVQIITIKPHCATPHVNLTVLHTDAIDYKPVVWAAQLTGMLDNISGDRDKVGYGDPVKIVVSPLDLDNNNAYGTVRTMGFHPDAYTATTPACVIVGISTEEGKNVYYKFNVLKQITAQEPTHEYNIVVDMKDAQPIDPDDPDKPDPDDPSSGQIRPSIDPFGSETIDIEMK